MVWNPGFAHQCLTVDSTRLKENLWIFINNIQKLTWTQPGRNYSTLQLYRVLFHCGRSLLASKLHHSPGKRKKLGKNTREEVRAEEGGITIKSFRKV
jgi:hypothetical protein